MVGELFLNKVSELVFVKLAWNLLTMICFNVIVRGKCLSSILLFIITLKHEDEGAILINVLECSCRLREVITVRSNIQDYNRRDLYMWNFVSNLQTSFERSRPFFKYSYVRRLKNSWNIADTLAINGLKMY